jgi:hypothetical protein
MRASGPGCSRRQHVAVLDKDAGSCALACLALGRAENSANGVLCALPASRRSRSWQGSRKGDTVRSGFSGFTFLSGSPHELAISP